MRYIVTGAANGIGQAISEKLARPGASFLLIDIDVDNLATVAGTCALLGASVTTSSADVRSSDEVSAAISHWFEDVIDKSGDVTLFAVAGIAETSEDNSFDFSHALSNVATNYFGVVNTVYSAVNYMSNAREGKVVVISSTSAYRSTRRSGEYSASKAALNLWAEGMRFKLLDRGITLYVIEPGFVATRMTEGNTHFMPFMVSREKMARMILSAINKKRYRTVLPKRALLYVFPMSVLPSRTYVALFRRLDRFLGKKES